MAIILYARKSVERENSISCETQLEYCKSVIKPDERDEKIITFVSPFDTPPFLMVKYV